MAVPITSQTKPSVILPAAFGVHRLAVSSRFDVADVPYIYLFVLEEFCGLGFRNSFFLRYLISVTSSAMIYDGTWKTSAGKRRTSYKTCTSDAESSDVADSFMTMKTSLGIVHLRVSKCCLLTRKLRRRLTRKAFRHHNGGWETYEPSQETLRTRHPNSNRSDPD